MKTYYFLWVMRHLVSTYLLILLVLCCTGNGQPSGQLDAQTQSRLKVSCIYLGDECIFFENIELSWYYIHIRNSRPFILTKSKEITSLRQVGHSMANKEMFESIRELLKIIGWWDQGRWFRKCWMQKAWFWFLSQSGFWRMGRAE